MKINFAAQETPLIPAGNTAINNEIKNISNNCIECRLCIQECKFLQHCGSPRQIASSYLFSAKSFDPAVPFSCSLCGLCEALCPKRLSPASMFLEMRRDAVRQGRGTFPVHNPIANFERCGKSKMFSYYGVPEKCDTVIFPGCSLPGARPDTVIKLYEYLQNHIPGLGIVLDCCTKPSHDLGREDYFHCHFNKINSRLAELGIRRVLTACPSCYRIFRQYGAGFQVETVYETLAQTGVPAASKFLEEVTVQDPCSIRFDEQIHEAVRYLILKMGLDIKEMPHHGVRTICCGEGGSVGRFKPELARSWHAARRCEAAGRRVIAYCAGCVNFMAETNHTAHILDLIFTPETAMAGKAKISKAPLTYLNRILLKRRLKKCGVEDLRRSPLAP